MIDINWECDDGILAPGEDCENTTPFGPCCDKSSNCKFKKPTVPCGPTPTQLCEVQAKCTGSSASCPANPPADQFTPCRAVAGPCDVAEVCDGTSLTCPDDDFLSSTTVCRATPVTCGGQCDIAERCTGSSAPCPDDIVKKKGPPCHKFQAFGQGNNCSTTSTCSGESRFCGL